MLLPGIVTIIALLNNLSTISFAQDTTSLSSPKEWTIPISPIINLQQGQLLPTTDGDKDSSISHTQKSCSKESYFPFERCDITVYTWLTGGIYKRTCTDLKISSSIGFPCTKTNVLSDYTILYVSWSESDVKSGHGDLYLSIINMYNCTVVTELSFFKQKSSAILNRPILFKNNFEVVVDNEEYCNGSARCIITYDFEGRKIGNPKPFVTSSHLIWPVTSLSPEKGYYTLSAYPKKAPRTLNITHVDSSGQNERLLITANITLAEGYADSTAYELYAFCWLKSRGSSQIHCIQTDTRGLRMNFTLELSETAHRIAIHNLADGGLLVITGTCEEKFHPGPASCTRQRIQRIAADGRRYGALYYESFKSQNAHIKYDGPTWITEKKDEFCFAGDVIKDNYQDLSVEMWCIPANSTLIE